MVQSSKMYIICSKGLAPSDVAEHNPKVYSAMSVTAAAAMPVASRTEVPKRLNCPKGMFRHVAVKIISKSEICLTVVYEFDGLRVQAAVKRTRRSK